ncbi:MAG: ABC transporter permease [Nanohaloarchaea archaeon]|nr:ABC transporter permease [Candidatus Nanohaloarchaea archaeon]
MGSLWDVGAKQVRDSFSSRKFLMVLGLFLVFSLGSVYIGVDNYQQQLEDFRSGSVYGPAPEKPSLIDVFAPMMQLNMPLAAALLALLLSYDAVSKEREDGTIELLLSYPVYRDEVINGKLVAGIFTLSFASLMAFTTSAGLAIFMTGVLPTVEELSRLCFMWFGTVIYLGFFLALGTLFSTVFRSSWRSLLASAAFLLAFLATPFLANIAASHIYTFDDSPPSSGGPSVPVERGMAVSSDVAVSGSTGVDIGRSSEREEKRKEVEQKRENFKKIVSRLSPSTSYSNYVGTMLGTSYNQQGVEPTMRESLMSSIGYLVYLLSQTMLMFTASYAAFMRQDL